MGRLQPSVRSPRSPHSLEDGSVMTIWFACNASAIIMAKVTSEGINLARPGAAVATTTRAGHHSAYSIELQLQCTMAQSAILHKCHYCCRWLCRLPLSQTDWQLNWKVWRHFSLFDLLPVARCSCNSPARFLQLPLSRPEICKNWRKCFLALAREHYSCI